DRGALQSDVVPQRLDLAARQLPDRTWLRTLRPQARGDADLQRAVRCRDLHGLAAIAGAVLWLPAPARARSDALSGGLLAAGVGQRHAVQPARSLARSGVRSRTRRNPFAQSTPAVI